MNPLLMTLLFISADGSPPATDLSQSAAIPVPGEKTASMTSTGDDLPSSAPIDTKQSYSLAGLSPEQVKKIRSKKMDIEKVS